MTPLEFRSVACFRAQWARAAVAGSTHRSHRLGFAHGYGLILGQNFAEIQPEF